MKAIIAVETRLGPDLKNAPALRGRVHSVFSRSFNVAFGDEILTVHADGQSGIPDSLLLKPEDFAGLRTEAFECAFWTSSGLLLDGTKIDTASAPDKGNFFGSEFVAASKPEIVERIHSIGFCHKLEGKGDSISRDIAACLAKGNFASCEKLLAKAIGLGPGLTPSADDAILGIAAAAFRYFADKNIPTKFSQAAYRISENRTSDISRKYLKCASQGRFAIPLIRVVDSLLSSGAQVDYQALAKLLASGHSSGKDTLRGAILAAEALAAPDTYGINDA